MSLVKLLRTSLHGAGRAVEDPEEGPEPRDLEEKPVHHGVDGALLEQHDLGHEEVVVDGECSVVVVDQGGAVDGDVLQAVDLVAEDHPSLKKLS